MTTPRIEEKDFHMMALAKSGSAKEYGELTVVQLGYVTELMKEAHQAGIDEAVEVAKAHYYTVNVDKQPTIQDEAWANQYDSKAEAFWYGEAKGLEVLDDTIKALQDNK